MRAQHVHALRCDRLRGGGDGDDGAQASGQVDLWVGLRDLLVELVEVAAGVRMMRLVLPAALHVLHGLGSRAA